MRSGVSVSTAGEEARVAALLAVAARALVMRRAATVAALARQGALDLAREEGGPAGSRRSPVAFGDVDGSSDALVTATLVPLSEAFVVGVEALERSYRSPVPSIHQAHPPRPERRSE